VSYHSCLHIRYKFSDFYFGEFLKIAKIGQNYIPAKKPGYTVYGDITIAGEGLQNLALRAFEQGGIFIVPHLL
jgi:hypothetical protein